MRKPPLVSSIFMCVYCVVYTLYNAVVVAMAAAAAAAFFSIDPAAAIGTQRISFKKRNYKEPG